MTKKFAFTLTDTSIILLFIALCGLSILSPINSLDELWNYQFAKASADGLRPYSEFSMLQTPGAVFFPAALMSIFGKELITLRIAEVIVFSAIITIFYYLAVRIIKSKSISFSISLIMLSGHYLCAFYNYNEVNSAIILLIMLISYFADDVAYPMVGILVGITPLIKQSTGLVVVATNLLLCITDFRKNKNNRKALLRIILSILPSAVYFIYLIASNEYTAFYEYTIEGVLSFSHRITPLDFAAQNPINIVLLLSLFGVYIWSILTIAKGGWKSCEVECLAFSIAALSIIFPLCDYYHVLIAMVTAAPMLLISLKYSASDTGKLLTHIICPIAAVGVTIISVYAMFINQDDVVLSKINHYQGLKIDRQLEISIESVDDYILKKESDGYKVYIADATAAAYSIPLDSYKKNWDMLLVGNLGKASVEELLSTDGKSLFLVRKEQLNYQSHFDLIETIKSKYCKIDEVDCFEVYKKRMDDN